MKKLEFLLEELWKRSRFTSYFFQSVHFIVENSIPTLALTLHSSRLVIYYNSAFLEKTEMEEMIGLLVHEMLHVVLSHDHRAYPGGDLYLQNLAQDMVINSYLRERKKSFFSRKDRNEHESEELILPPGLPGVPKNFFAETGTADPSWEEVYRWLKEQPGKGISELKGASEKGTGLNLSLPGSAMDRLSDAFAHNPAEPGPGEAGDETRFEEMAGIVFRDEREEILPTGVHLFLASEELSKIDSKKSRIISLADNDRDCLQERSFQYIRGIIERIRETDIDSWKHQLKSIIDFSAQSSEWTYTYGRFNRRYFADGIYAPGRIFKEQEVLTVAVDVSGSMVMTPAEIEAAFGVIEELLGKYRVHLVCMDENLFVPEKKAGAFSVSRDLSKPYVYARGDWRYLKTGSGGTTFFAPLFNQYMKKHREMLLVITDGYIYDIQALKRYASTIWVVSGHRTEPFHPPFGQVVALHA